MDCTFTFSLGLYDDEGTAQECYDAVMTAFRKVKAATKKSRPAKATAPLPPVKAGYVVELPAKEEPAVVELVTVPSTPPAAVPEPAAEAQVDIFEGLDDSHTLKGSMPEVAPKRRGRGKAKSVSEQVISAGVVEAAPEQTEAAADADPFGAPVDSLQELTDLGNAVCHDCGPKVVLATLQSFKAGRYDGIPRDKWVDVAREWRKAIHATVKA